jgi:hypothetical protein
MPEPTPAVGDLTPERRDLPAKPKMQLEDWYKIFDRYDEGNIKPGAPYVGVYGAMRCAWCQGPIIEVEGKPQCGQCRREMNILVDPMTDGNIWQRRQLNIEAPKERKLSPDLTMETGGKGGPVPGRPRNPSFDIEQYPSQTGPSLGA